MAKRLFRLAAGGPTLDPVDRSHPLCDPIDMTNVRGLDGPDHDVCIYESDVGSQQGVASPREEQTMYPAADTRSSYTEAAAPKPTPIQPGELAGIHDKIISIINLTSGTNDQLAYTVDRLLGGTDGSTNRPASDSPQRSGEIGQIEVALDTLFRLAGRNSDLTSAISRL